MAVLGAASMMDPMFAVLGILGVPPSYRQGLWNLLFTPVLLLLILAIGVAAVCAVIVMVRGPGIHRLRVVIWSSGVAVYALLHDSLASLEPEALAATVLLVANGVATATPVVWLVRTIRDVAPAGGVAVFPPV